MPEKKNKNKEYEPPMVKEIGGTFEQAMGVTACPGGGNFKVGQCPMGGAPSEGCPGGLMDQGCSGGGRDVSCTTGWGG